MGKLWFVNVRLETGFEYGEEHVVRTETALFNLLIENDMITKIESSNVEIQDNIPQKDMRGYLMVPPFRDMHMHLDKTTYGGEWKAPTPFVSILGRLKEEEVLLPKLLPVLEERAEKIIDLHISKGTTHIRAQVNVDPIIGLKHIEGVNRVLERYKTKISSELVAFPQQGLLRSDAQPLIRQALREGATHVGAVDPATVDEDIEKSLYTLFDLAVEGNAGVDIHIHDQGLLGTYTMKRLAAYTEQANWQGRVTIGHGFGLGEVDEGEVREVAHLLMKNKIDLASTVPFEAGFSTPPIPLLTELGVDVSLANDSILDHWEAFGTGDMLYKASILAERFSLIDEYSLSRVLAYVSAGKTTLNDGGIRIWPRVGDEASGVFIDASCSAEAVARRSERKATLYKGNLTASTM